MGSLSFLIIPAFLSVSPHKMEQTALTFVATACGAPSSGGRVGCDGCLRMFAVTSPTSDTDCELFWHNVRTSTVDG